MKTRKLAILFVLLSLVALGQTTHYEAPVFSAEFPSGAEVQYSRDASEADRVLNTYMATYDNDNAAFFASYVDASFTLASGSDKEDAAIDRGIANAYDMATVSVTRSNSRVGDWPARAALVHGKSKGSGAAMTSYIRCAISGNRMWLPLVVVSDNDTRFTASEANAFLDSIKLH